MGHGGAGLFSDGKFSFFPSATRLWQLDCRDVLRAAYDWTCGLLDQHGLATPPYPNADIADHSASDVWALKEYPSSYLSLDKRIELINSLLTPGQSVSFDRTVVQHLSFSNIPRLFGIDLLAGDGLHSSITARCVIMATGRFGPLQFPGLYPARDFQRLEVGFRIEQPSHRAFFANLAQLDPKFCFRDGQQSVEWRTFCVCREGTTALAHVNDIWAVSGHSDCPPTGRSNLGFNTRILDEGVAARNMLHLTQTLKDRSCYFSVPLQDVLSGNSSALSIFDRIYGPQLREHMITGLCHLIDRFPSIDHETTNLIGPTLEGVGWYPATDGSLRMPTAPAWVAGDACGRFRGIVAAFISGHYTASMALREIRSQETVAA